ncbi:MAG: S-layer homology domain-containing protein [Coleofasciculaceae cyanobacterium]
MTNTPPPDHGSSRISLDEWIGIIVAFTTIGTILVVTLIPREKGFNLSQYLIGTDKNAPVVEPEKKPSQEEQSSRQIIVPSPSPSPQTSVPAPPAEPITPVEPKSEIVEETTAPVVPVVPTQPASSATTDNASIEPSPSPTAKSVKFTDVPEDLWARPYIEALATQGIMNGFPDGSFQPGGSITRVEFASVLTKAFEKETNSELPDFQDIPADFSALPAVRETVKTGFLRGYPDRVFRPSQLLPRVQAIVALASGLDLDKTTDTEALQIYQDASKIPNYAKEKVSWATAAGLVFNYPNPQMLNPNRNATRAEVAALVYQALVKTGRVEKIPSQYIAQPQSAK